MFPFIYKDVEYSTCTDKNHDAQWCATKTDVEGKFINDEWGNCDVGCPGFRGIKIYFMSKYGYAVFIALENFIFSIYAHFKIFSLH